MTAVLVAIAIPVLIVGWTVVSEIRDARKECKRHVQDREAIDFALWAAELEGSAP